MVHYEAIKIDEELKIVKLCNRLGNIFGLLFLFGIFLGLINNNLFYYINGIIFGLLFISSLIGKSLSTIRLDIHYKK